MIFTLVDAREERLLMEARIEARNALKAARAHRAFMATKAGKEIAWARSLRWAPPQYRGGAAEWYLNNASPSTTPAPYSHIWN